MNTKTKIITLAIITLLTTSYIVTLTVNSTNAQKPNPPSVPEFNVKLVSHPYDVPPSNISTFDTSTWTEIITTKPGYREENRSIEVIIKNQPFTPYTLHTSERDYPIDLYYVVQVKDNLSEDWRSFRYSIYSYTYQAQSNFDYTVVSGSANYTDNTQLNFRVQAVIGYRYSATADSLAAMWIGPADSMSFSTSSDWSTIQTLNITGDSVSYSTPNPTTPNTPSQTTTLPENPTITPKTGYNNSIINFTSKNYLTSINILLGIIALLIGIITILIVLLVIKRHPKTMLQNNNFE